MNLESAPPPLLPSDSALEWLTGLALIGGGVVLGNAVTLLYVVPADRLPIGPVAAVLTAAAALLGVYLTNRSNAARLERQLQHDREIQSDQLKAERALSQLENAAAQKKEVVFAAADAAQEAVDTLFKLLDDEYQTSEFTQDLRRICRTIGKVRLVCAASTEKVVSDFVLTFWNTAKTEIDARQPMLLARLDVDSREKVARSKSNAAEAHLARWKANQANDQEGEHSFQWLLDDLKKSNEELKTAHEKLATARKACSEALGPRASLLVEANKKVQSALRGELVDAG